MGNQGARRNSGRSRRSSEKNRKKQTPLSLQLAELSMHLFLTLFFYLAAIVIVSKLANSAYQFTFPIFANVSVEDSPGTDVTIHIEEGDDLKNIAQNLEKAHVIRNAGSFWIRCKLSLDELHYIKSGTYKLNTSQNYGEILEVLTASEEDGEK